MMTPFRRIILIVFDSLGVGELPDASSYGDTGSNTLLHTDQALKGLNIPNLNKLGMMSIVKAQTSSEVSGSFFGRMKEESRGKDTTTGHWEMMGITLEKPFDTFPNGFPDDFMKLWSQKTGLGYLGNKPASGTVIIDELGAEHLRTGHPIVYTSADSVFQIAAHEKYFGLQKLYDICALSRELLNQSRFQVGRVIARPFVGEPGTFKRTGNRRDYSLAPWKKTTLDELKSAGFSVVGVGKIPYIFDFQGITTPLEAHNDEEAVEATIRALKTESKPGLIFTNLNDLDMIYGHRRNAEGYGHHLEELDRRLPEILSHLKADDLLILTADHGNDPTYKGTDHTREYVPLLAFSPSFKKVSKPKLPDRETFADIGQTILDNFRLSPLTSGTSFLPVLAEAAQV